MNRILANRVVKLEEHRRLRGDYADWTDEQLQQRIDELKPCILAHLDASTQQGRIPIDVVLAEDLDLSEQQKAHLRALYTAHFPDRILNAAV